MTMPAPRPEPAFRVRLATDARARLAAERLRYPVVAEALGGGGPGVDHA